MASATATGMTAAAMQAIADATIKTGAVDSNGNLILTRNNNQTVNAGNVVGPITVGLVTLYAGTVIPAGWLLCDGTAVSRTSYANLFAAIGTVYGAGDGSTTFNLPNLKGRIPVGRDTAQTEFDSLGETGGAKTHTLVSAEMPAHTHTQASHNHTITDNGHVHTQVSHNHTITDNGHIHTQVAHTHTQSPHNHTITDNGHNHTQDPHTHALMYELVFQIGTNRSGFFSGGTGGTTTGATVSTTATNNSATTGITLASTTPPALGNSTPTINSATTGITLAGIAPTINSATTGITLASATPTINNTGGDGAHNNLQPYLVMNYIIKY